MARDELTDPFELAAFRLLDQPHTAAALTRKAAARAKNAAREEREVQQLLDAWLELGLVFTDGGQYVHIAPSAVNEDLLRLDFMRHAQAALDAAEQPARPEPVSV
ncbi:hypothetical protein ACWCPS_04225 [Streptomyces mauvecolor]